VSSRDEAGPILNGIPSQLPDIDPDETAEWLESLDGVLAGKGRTRTRYLMLKLLERAREMQVGVPSLTATDYINTISPESEPWFPGDEDVERRYRAWLRWNAAVIVHRAQAPGIGVGGHISSYASSATLYEVGFNHFFRGADHPGGGDQLYVQGHASPGIYARAFLEGRLSEDDLDGFRQELSHAGGGMPSYPHPRLMPDFWQFPTVSMGLGPMNAIYQAQFNKYLHARGIKDTTTSGRSWATARWTNRRAAACCTSPPTRSSTISPSSSTATCSGSTDRCAATARSSRSSRRPSAAPVGTSSR
jgi:pyruvate dehydrogenase E1 component